MIFNLLYAGLLAATTFGFSYSMEALIVVTAVYSTIFYILTSLLYFSLFEIDRSAFYNQIFISESIVKAIIRTVGVVVVVTSSHPYAFVGILAIPYVIINVSVVIFSWLVCKGYLEINDE